MPGDDAPPGHTTTRQAASPQLASEQETATISPPFVSEQGRLVAHYVIDMRNAVDNPALDAQSATVTAEDVREWTLGYERLAGPWYGPDRLGKGTFLGLIIALGGGSLGLGLAYLFTRH